MEEKLRARTEKSIDVTESWPEDWAGFPEDVAYGHQLVAEMRPFIVALQQSLSPKTVRNHTSNLWLIGGEVIRRVNDEPSYHQVPAIQLLLEAVENGEAPPVSGLSEGDQRALDATARKLLKFISKA